MYKAELLLTFLNAQQLEKVRSWIEYCLTPEDSVISDNYEKSKLPSHEHSGLKTYTK